MAQASRYLAWLASTSLTLSVQEVTTAGAARELVAFSVRARDQILRLADPDPPYAAGATDMGTPLTDARVACWPGSAASPSSTAPTRPPASTRSMRS